MESFADLCSYESVAVRSAAIQMLPHKIWHGRLVFQVCCAECGHERWESEAILWCLMSLKHHVCNWCHAKGPPAERRIRESLPQPLFQQVQRLKDEG